MSSRPMTYADAVHLLEGEASPITELVDGALAAADGTVDVFAVRDELLAWGRSTATGIRERVRGCRRADRTRILEAAHAVLAVTAHLAAFDEPPDPGGGTVSELMLIQRVRAGSPAAADQPFSRQLISRLFRTPPPMPAANDAFETHIDAMSDLYEYWSDPIADFCLNLVPAMDAMMVDLRPAAVRLYERGFQTLVEHAPECGFWTAGFSELGTRDREVGLRAVARILDGVTAGGDVAPVRAGLAARYRARLGEAILRSVDIPAGITMPRLAEGYVNPRGRVAEAGRGTQPSVERWWQDTPVLDDLQGFFAGYLTGPAAVEAPLVILGQPGSGKSVLTRVLAARLPAADFTAVRVELRNVPADASVQTQIEEALHQTLGERVGWADLTRQAGNAMPVVILDGFDELLQATGANRADFLEQVQEFQTREADLGRPCAVIVTSRTVVADRARFPEGTTVLRLEEFDDRQVERWLDVWNGTNAGGLARRGLRPLPVAAVLQQRHLAGQPLLLLLLALYDAGGNALQAAGAKLGQVELYERLFEDFAGREVDKHDTLQGTDRRRAAIDAELRRLSAVALAMFNRGADVIAAPDLEADLRVLLLPGELTPADGTAAHRALTPGQLLVGRFFFIHESQAGRDTGAAERSFEFLHATFGEFLAARLIVDTLVELAEEREQRRLRPRSVFDPGYLFAITSFATITRRTPVRDFCQGLLDRLPDGTRQRCRALALELLPEAGFPHPTWSHQVYEPHRRPVAARHAAFSANLVWFVVALSAGPVRVAELVGEPAVIAWRRLATLWYSQLEHEDNQNLRLNLRVEWTSSVYPHLEVRREDGADVSVYRSLPWPPDKPRLPQSSVSPDVLLPADSKAGLALRRSAFVQTTIDLREYVYALMPYLEQIGDVRWIEESETVTDAALLLRLLLEPPTAEERFARLVQAIGGGGARYEHALLRQLVVDAAHDEDVDTLLLRHFPPKQVEAEVAAMNELLEGIRQLRFRLDHPKRLNPAGEEI